MVTLSMTFIKNGCEKISFFGIKEYQTHIIEFIKVGHDQLPEFGMIAMMVLAFAQTICGCIQFSNPVLVIFFQSDRFSVWVKIRNTINNVINTVSIKDRFQPSNVINRGFCDNVADFYMTVIHICNTF